MSGKRPRSIFILPVLCSILLAAHFSRIQNDILAGFFLVFPLLLFFRKRWILRLYQIYLLAGFVIWIERALFLRQVRIAAGEPWERMGLILFLVAVLGLVAALLLQKRHVLSLYSVGSYDGACLAAFFFTGGLLFLVHLKVDFPILLLERFLPGSGMIEIILLGIYAAWLTEKMAGAKDTSLIRIRLWLLFSLVFFTQFILGTAGLTKLLMTGELHLPIPALILAGPLFRGTGIFMPLLFLGTVILSGPAWCSHLCYIGSWDNYLSRRLPRAGKLPSGWSYIRVGIFAGVVLFALGFRLAGVSYPIATGAALIFGGIGIGVMVFISRSLGIMFHCTVFCPISLAADVIGKISPFRLKIAEGCDDCGACSRACRYYALTAADIAKRRPGLSCTLCGDCLPSCNKDQLGYGFLAMRPRTARLIFITFIISLHAIFLGVARI